MTKQRKGIDFRQHFIELLVVIIGISIAFALEGWASSRKQDTLQANYINSLKTDLEKDKADLQQIIDSTNVILGHVGEVFQFLYQNKPVEAYRRHHITSSYLASYFYPQSGTYVSLINSGDINVLEDFEVKSELSNLYNVQYRELERMDNVIRILVDNTIQPYMIDQIKFSFTRDGIEDIGPMRENKTMNMLGSFFNLLSARQEAYKKMMESCDQLIGVLDKATEK